MNRRVPYNDRHCLQQIHPMPLTEQSRSASLRLRAQDVQMHHRWPAYAGSMFCLEPSARSGGLSDQRLQGLNGRELALRPPSPALVARRVICRFEPLADTTRESDR
jgi:hypothetical protein